MRGSLLHVHAESVEKFLLNSVQKTSKKLYNHLQIIGKYAKWMAEKCFFHLKRTHQHGLGKLFVQIVCISQAYILV